MVTVDLPEELPDSHDFRIVDSQQPITWSEQLPY